MTKLPYESHQYANLFPLDEGKPLWEMSDDIKLHGLQVPIVLYQDKVLDGRRRLLACLRVGVEPKYRKFSGGDESALAFVVSHNLHRRHLGTGDRSIIAAKIADMTREQTLKKGNVFPDAPKDATGKTQEKAAELMNVSRRSVQRAADVINNGTPELQKAVEEHVISVTDAAKIATEPPKVQRAAVEQVKAGKSATAAAAVKKPGSVKYDWNASDKQFGAVARWPDQVAAAYPGEKKSDEYKKVIALLTELGEVRKGWHMRLKKVKD